MIKTFLFLTLVLTLFITIVYLNIILSLKTKSSPILIDYKVDRYSLSSDFKILKDGDLEYKKIDFKNYKKDHKIINFDKPVYEIITAVNLKDKYPDNNKFIPKLIWQTFKEEIEEDNPLYDKIKSWKNQKGYKYHFIDDVEGLKFLKENFEDEVWQSFQVLIPGAFKADLLRACLVYIHGGVYADIKVELIFPLDYFLDKELVLTKDRDSLGIWNGFFGAKKKHPYLKKVIDGAVYMIKNKKYGGNTTDITGPQLWANVFIKNFWTLPYKHTEGRNYRFLGMKMYEDKMIISKNNNYEPYLQLQMDYHRHYGKYDGYTKLWHERKVYNEELWKEYFGN